MVLLYLQATGANTILIGVQIGTGGNATNLTIIGNAITSLLSNLVLLGVSIRTLL